MTPSSTILIGDVLDKLQEIPNESVHCIFADPPYNQGVDYGKGKAADLFDTEDYFSWCRSWIRKCCRILVPSGSLWVLTSERWANSIGSFLSDYIPRRNRIIWREKFGQYKESKFASGHRHLFYHAGPDHYWNPDEIRIESVRMKMGDKRAAGPRVPDDVWDVSRLQGNDRERVEWHPCQLRQWPLERIIKCCTKPGDTVLDPFMGSGSTGVAALKLHRNFIGIELNPEYARLAEKRIQETSV